MKYGVFTYEYYLYNIFLGIYYIGACNLDGVMQKGFINPHFNFLSSIEPFEFLSKTLKKKSKHFL